MGPYNTDSGTIYLRPWLGTWEATDAVVLDATVGCGKSRTVLANDDDDFVVACWRASKCHLTLRAGALVKTRLKVQESRTGSLGCPIFLNFQLGFLGCGVKGLEKTFPDFEIFKSIL
jgi:hypothetical protein